MHLFVLLVCILASASGGPYIDDPDCPRKRDLALNRKCLKKCHIDADCRGKNKRCLCDDVCGRSCVKPTIRCQTLKPIFDGKFKIDTFNRFGARAMYTCNDGYILSGMPERVCQGDGYWSGEPPSCETEGKCRNPPVVAHTTHDGARGVETFALGTQLTYRCRQGYDMDGFFRAMCVGEGRWVGPRMTCSPRRCDHPGDIPNGHRTGNAFVFPERVTYNCSEGYRLLGRPYRVCQADGTWSHTRPTCRPVKCPPIKSIAHGMVDGSHYTYGAHVHFSCLTGFTLRGSTARMCRQDGRWSGEEAVCAIVDCGLPGPFYNGFLDPLKSTYGTVITFLCNIPATLDGPSRTAECLENGTWSHPLPNCWSKCKVPYIQNATILGYDVGSLVHHGNELKVECSKDFELESNQDPKCFNGSWEFTHKCVPKSCRYRPKTISDARLRIYTTNHGDKAIYVCNIGNRLRGDGFLTCQYGKWVGKPPTCETGNLMNGEVLLVGQKGKYEYRHYVRNVVHNDRIEFRCNKGYDRIGPAASTCIAGVWSPTGLPVCQPKQHPTISPVFMYRSRRSSNATIDEIRGTGECPHPGRFRNGKILRHEGERSKRLRRNDTAPNNSTINYICRPHFKLMGKEEATCRQGKWEPSIKPTCIIDKVQCEDRSTRTGEDSMTRIVYLPRNDTIPNYGRRHRKVYVNQFVQFKCSNDKSYYLNGPDTAVCTESGRWDPEQLPNCIKRETCPFPGVIDNGEVLLIGKIGKYAYRPYVKNVVSGDKIEYNCEDNYQLQGAPSAVCGGTGMWEPPELPTCVRKMAVRCSYPGTIYGGRIYLIGKFGKYEYRHYVRNVVPGNVIEYVCGKEFQLQGADSAVCGETGRFEPSTLPKCIKKTESKPSVCQHPELLDHGSVRVRRKSGDKNSPSADIREGDKVRFQCDEGYTLQGHTSATCEGGAWVPPENPICSPDHCPSPGLLENGEILSIYSQLGGIKTIEPTTDIVYWRLNDSIKYQCNEDFILDGPESAVCDSSKKWVPDQKPWCRSRNDFCKYTEDIRHGESELATPDDSLIIFRDEATYFGKNTTIRYRCGRGFSLEGPRESVCIGRHWHPEERPVCRMTRST